MWMSGVYQAMPNEIRFFVKGQDKADNYIYLSSHICYLLSVTESSLRRHKIKTGTFFQLLVCMPQILQALMQMRRPKVEGLRIRQSIILNLCPG
jgi:hypothetical protein